MAFQNIYITHRTENSESKVYLWDDEKGLEIMPYSKFRYAYTRDPSGEFLSMYGDRLKKVKRFQYDDPSLFESDVSKETRVLTDVYLDSDDPSTNHRTMFFDIETDSANGFGVPETATKAITAIASYYKEKDEYMGFILDPNSELDSTREGNKTVISCQTEDELLTMFLEYYGTIFPTLLVGWNSDGYDVPYLYNRLVNLYGIETANRLSPVGIVEYNPYRMKYRIAGVSSMDYLPIYKKYRLKERPNYQLGTVGKIEVGLGKVEFEGNLAMLFASDKAKFLEYNFRDVEILVKLDDKLRYIDLMRFICHIGHVQYEDCLYSSKFIEGTILTYLHRKGIVASNKPVGGREEFDKKQSTHAEGFTGAYVKVPYSQLYQWVYSLDLQSLYPSIIMSLNISPETKVGKITNWDVDKHIRKQLTEYIVERKGKTQTFSRESFMSFMSTNRYTISSNGILYNDAQKGIIPSILEDWFEKRKEYKGLMKKYANEKNAELEGFYDRRQHVQKILLNSIYGVLGLSIFRFYDLDNALAVTASGQDVIKTSAKFINKHYERSGVAPKDERWMNRYREIVLEHGGGQEVVPNDHCIYIDTDSVYFSSLPLLPEGADKKKFTVQLAREMEKKLNEFYTPMAKLLFFCNTHRFVIKGESIVESGIWIQKKRYALKKVYDLETDMDKEEIVYKGLDVVRSSFPMAFRDFMSEFIPAILNLATKQQMDDKIIKFQSRISSLKPIEIARNIAVKNISGKTINLPSDFSTFQKGTPVHVKAAINYNRVLARYGRENQFAPIKDGDKIKYVYLSDNPFKIKVLAFKTYNDPPEVLQLIEDYIDYEKIFESELEEKLTKFYDVLEWGDVPTKVNQCFDELFM